ncbi:MAG: DHH family phosphoesterase [bacterium]
MESLYTQVNELIKSSKNIVVLQADNPDGDSLASALALESILGDLGKEVTMVCGIDMPAHLRYLSGWSRVQKDLPSKFDITILVDASTVTLLETLDNNGQLAWVKTKPLIILDHHAMTSGIPFAKITINNDSVSTGEVIYDLAKANNIPMSVEAMEYIAVSIMSDSLGLTTDATTSKSIRIIADLVDGGVSLSGLDDARRELMKRDPVLLPYKGQLLQRVEFYDNNSIAIITIPWKEIETYSSMYNPSMLALDDMRMTTGVRIAIAFKTYTTGRVTAKIRCNSDGAIAGLLAEHFGGGGHKFAAGFKANKVVDFIEFKKEVITKATELLKEIN